ncbi:MAG: isocitrate/isopropylmalate family dehydrogenase [Thermoleophilaceae bacterium]
MAYRVTFISGDGTGPEISEATSRVLDATGVEFDWDWQTAGTDVYEEEGNPLPDRVLESIKERGLAMKAPITTPVGSGFRSINVQLRKELDLYACLRPCKAYEGVRTRFPETDIVIVRENHEDLYAGVEYEKGAEDTARLREFIADTEGTRAARGHRGDHQGHLRVRHRAHRARGLQVRAVLRAQEDHPRAQGQHHEVLGRPVPRGRPAPRRRGVRRLGHRVRGADHRQPLQPARLPARGVRRHRAARTSTGTSSPTWGRG